jgi:hypothetical protein
LIFYKIIAAYQLRNINRGYVLYVWHGEHQLPQSNVNGDGIDFHFRFRFQVQNVFCRIGIETKKIKSRIPTKKALPK